MKKHCLNFLDYVPFPSPSYTYEIGEDGRVLLKIEHRGLINKLAQKLLGKPRVTYLRLDDLGSFVWLDMDGKKTVYAVSRDVGRKFGDAAEPLLERLATFFSQLYAGGFILYEVGGETGDEPSGGSGDGPRGVACDVLRGEAGGVACDGICRDAGSEVSGADPRSCPGRTCEASAPPTR